jgi:hypothetical protein
VSTYGRAQDALYALLWGFEANYAEWHPGLLHDKLSFKEVTELIDPILECISPIFHESGEKLDSTDA